MTDRINEAVICAGFGGQGIITLGKVVANAALEKGFHLTCLSSYGAEVRGGTAHSMVKISTGPLANPRIDTATCLVAMNEPSLERFLPRLAAEGLAIVNSTMVYDVPARGAGDIVQLPLTDMAIELGNIKVANMIAAGVLDARKNIFGRDILVKVIEKMAKGREELIPVNIEALDAGYSQGRDNTGN